MMDYEVFKNVFVERIKEFLPPMFRNFDVGIHLVPKTNEVKEAMIMMLETADEVFVSPNIYLDDVYEAFKECQDLDAVMADSAAVIVSFTGTQPVDPQLQDMEKLKGNIVKVLVNTERNLELLETAAHKKWLDLSIIYRMIVPDEDAEGFASTVLNRELQECLGLTDEELDAIAEENGRNNFKTQVVTLAGNARILTTEVGLFGAAAMLRSDALREIAEAAGDDLYLIPSSVHEMFVFPAENCDLTGLKKTLKEGNSKYTSTDEFLSDSIYYYNRESETVTIAAK